MQTDTQIHMNGRERGEGLWLKGACSVEGCVVVWVMGFWVVWMLESSHFAGEGCVVGVGGMVRSRVQSSLYRARLAEPVWLLGYLPIHFSTLAICVVFADVQ